MKRNKSSFESAFSEACLAIVSVIIPCYNRGNFLAQTLESALIQTYSYIEIIAVDDGSTDNTGDILERYKNRVKVLQHRRGENKGQSASINLALGQIRGKYVAILDSDDIWLPAKIEKQVAFLDAHPDVGLVYTNGYAINEKGERLYTIFPPDHIENSDPARTLLECHFNVPSNSLVRRSIYEQVGGFDELMRSAQDHDMGIRISEITRLAYLDETLWCYRRHPDSQSGKHAMRRWKTGFRILINARCRYPYSLNVIRKRLAVLNFRVGQCYYEDKNFLVAMCFFFIAGILDPLRVVAVLNGRQRITSPHS